MGSRKPPTEVHTEVEIAEAKVEADLELRGANNVLEQATDSPEEPSHEKFNQHVKNLVALYAQQIVQELEQRVSDLEMLAQQPQDSVRFYGSGVTNRTAIPEPPNQDADGNVPWYTPAFMG